MELHLMLGVVNRLFKHLDTALDGELEELWSLPLGMKRAPQYGGEFNGNHRRTLLKHLSCLDELQETEKQVERTEDCRKCLKCVLHRINRYAEFEAVLDVFLAFNKVVHAYFGTKLDKDFEYYIKDFGDSYCFLGLSVTPKVHAILCHVKQFLNRKGAHRGLGDYSEQASEAVHSNFYSLWATGRV